MQHKWIKDLETNLDKFLDSLQRDVYKFNPVKKGITSNGNKLELGLSCYAIKIYFITGRWDSLPNHKKETWIKFINSFQSSKNDFATNAFIDKEYIKAYNEFSLTKNIKETVKSFLIYLNYKDYRLRSEKLEDFITAESKQAISTLIQVNYKPTKQYQSKLMGENAIHNYLNSLNWQNAWNAGAQFSSLCVFVSTQVEGNKKQLLKNILVDFMKTVSNPENGGFYTQNIPEERELINGAMKVITGLDWLGAEIPYPKKLIDTCLNAKPNMEGCDIVDIIYVLYMCNGITDYRSEDIKEYFETLLSLIESHYFFGEGGFSYFLKKSQTHYYGVEISKGLNTPDLHGTLLLIWGISMIAKVVDLPISNWNILKP
ncbi:hypothetical protein OAY26_03895 [Acidimicrobiia bacterium]|nr:hypothetical protein [Acidimicrobiia bacterium]